MKLKVVVFLANPRIDLYVEKEYKILQDVYLKSKYRENIEIVGVVATTIRDFINRINNEKPHIIHYIGHSEDGNLKLENEEFKGVKNLSKEDFAKVIDSLENLKLVFLNSCYSKEIIDFLHNQSNQSCCCIGMNGEIKNETAEKFSKQFYASLFANVTIKEAFEQALTVLPKDEASIPKLLGKNCEFKISDIVNDTTDLKERLIEIYTTQYKTINLIDEREKIAIDDIFVNLAIIKDESEEEKNKEKGNDDDKLKNRDDYLASYENIYKPKEPIEIKELIDKSRIGNSSKSVILGKPGVGKTTLCHYIAYHWAKGKLYQEYDLVIYIPLRRWKGSLVETIQNIYLKNNSEIDIRKLTNNTLFIFDGYDELVNKNDFIDEINNDYLLNYIITTRPYNYAKGELAVNVEYETIGYTEENIEKYIDKFFKDNKEKAEKLKEYINENINIKQITYIPIMLTIICLLYRGEELQDGSLTLTDLYTEMIDKFLTEYHEKIRKDENVYDSLNQDEIKKILGKIAFFGLKEQKIIFDKRLIDSISILTYEEKRFLKDIGVHAGFIKTENRSKDLYNNKFEFIHLTFQEYFAAYYVSTLSYEDQSKIIRDWKFYPHMQMFFIFLAGLIDNKEFLIKEIQNEPKDIVGFYEILLVLDVLSQIRGNNSFALLSKIKTNIIDWINTLINNSSLAVLLNKLKYLNFENNENIIELLIIYLLIPIPVTSKEIIFDFLIKIREVSKVKEALLNPDTFLSNNTEIVVTILSYQNTIYVNTDLKKVFSRLFRHYYLKSTINALENFFNPLEYKDNILDMLFSIKLKEYKNFQEKLLSIFAIDEVENNIKIELFKVLMTYFNTSENNGKSLDNIFDYLLVLIKKIEGNYKLQKEVISVFILYYNATNKNELLDNIVGLLEQENISLEFKELFAWYLYLFVMFDINNYNNVKKLLKKVTIAKDIKDIVQLTFQYNLRALDIKNNDLSKKIIIQEILEVATVGNYKLSDVLKNYNILKNSNIIDLLFETINNLDNNDRKAIKKIIEYFKELKIEKNNKLINRIVILVKNEQIHYSKRVLLATALIDLIARNKNIKNENLFDELINIVSDRKIDMDVRYTISTFLYKLIINQNRLLKTINLVETQHKIEQIILKGLIETLCKIENSYTLNTKIYSFIENYILDKNISEYKKYDIIRHCLINNNDKKLHIILNYYNANYNEFPVEIIANLTYINKNIILSIKYFNEAFIEKSSIEAIFLLYDNFCIDVEAINKNLIFNRLPLFIENNKLCTIFEGRKICTQRDFDNE